MIFLWKMNVTVIAVIYGAGAIVVRVTVFLCSVLCLVCVCLALFLVFSHPFCFYLLRLFSSFPFFFLHTHTHTHTPFPFSLSLPFSTPLPLCPLHTYMYVLACTLYMRISVYLSIRLYLSIYLYVHSSICIDQYVYRYLEYILKLPSQFLAMRVGSGNGCRGRNWTNTQAHTNIRLIILLRHISPSLSLIHSSYSVSSRSPELRHWHAY